jgi:hypothetical protein
MDKWLHYLLTTPTVLKKNRGKNGCGESNTFPMFIFNVACVLDVFHEERVKMNEINDIWYGYLEAGEKSSPVLIDPKLETGDTKTVYMYNLNSQRIIEYKREIAEPKLRILNEQEASLVNALKQGYDTARKEFAPRNHTAIPLATATGTGTGISIKTLGDKNADLDDSDTLDEFDIDDSDIGLGDEMNEDLGTDEE